MATPAVHANAWVCLAMAVGALLATVCDRTRRWPMVTNHSRDAWLDMLSRQIVLRGSAQKE